MPKDDILRSRWQDKTLRGVNTSVFGVERVTKGWPTSKASLSRGFVPVTKVSLPLAVPIHDGAQDKHAVQRINHGVSTRVTPFDPDLDQTVSSLLGTQAVPARRLKATSNVKSGDADHMLQMFQPDTQCLKRCRECVHVIHEDQLCDGSHNDNVELVSIKANTSSLAQSSL